MVKLDNKTLVRCFGVRYHRIFLLSVCILTCSAGSSKYTAILHTETSNKIYLLSNCISNCTEIG